MALTQWLTNRNLSTVLTTPTMQVPADIDSAFVQLTSNNWVDNGSGIQIDLWWSPDDGNSWLRWEGFSVMSGQLSSKGNMPGFSVSRRTEQPATFLAYAELRPIGTVRVGVRGEFV